MKHTKEPWVVQCFSRKMSVEGNLHIVANTDRYPTAFVPAWNDPMPGEVNAAEEAEANARRIVDCVNALAGIADPAAYVATTTDLQARLDAAEAKNAELVKALDKCRCIIKYHVKNAGACCTMNGEVFSALDAYAQAVEALARTQGEKP